MPLLLTKKISPSGIIGVWNLQETEEELLALAELGSDEKETAARMPVGLKRRQFIGVRALLRALHEGGSESRIVYDEFHKPSLQNSTTKISVSHSFHYVALIMDSLHDTGIDIEQVRPQVDRLPGKFMSDAEMGSLQPGNRSEQLTIFWAVKEALYKLYGKKNLIFRENLIIDPFSCGKSGEVTARILTTDFDKKYFLRYEQFDGFVLVYVVRHIH